MSEQQQQGVVAFFACLRLCLPRTTNRSQWKLLGFGNSQTRQPKTYWLPLKSWPEYFGPHLMQELVVEPQSTNSGPLFHSLQCWARALPKTHKSVFVRLRSNSKSEQQHSAQFQAGPFPSSSIFLFLKRGIPPFSFNPISFSLEAAKEVKPSSHQAAVYFLGVKQQPQRNTQCPGPPPVSGRLWGRVWRCWDVSLALSDGWKPLQAPGCPSGLDIHQSSGGAAAPEPAQRAAQQRFYLQPADNGVEIDRSCRQQVTPCLSAPMAAPAITPWTGAL